MIRSSIKNKFTIGFFIIFLLSNVFMNLAIRRTVENNQRSEIENSMDTLLNSSREFIKESLRVERGEVTEAALEKSAYGLAVKLSLLNRSYVAIRNTTGKTLEEINTDIPYGAVSETSDVTSALKNTSRYFLRSFEGRIILSFSYPLYLDEHFTGIISFRQDYTEAYRRNRSLIEGITLIQAAALILSLLLSQFLIRKLTEPLKKLKNAMENMRKGDYEGEIRINRSDEAGVLALSFNMMREEIRKYIADLKYERDKVLKMERARKEFFDNITHELKTPLTGISAYAQILSSGAWDEEFKIRASERILEESRRLHGLVLDLIEVSKGKSEIEEENVTVDLADLIDKVIADLGKKAESYGIRFKIDIKVLIIHGRRNKLKQLFINLIDNAIKYSIQDSTVFIKGYMDDEGAWIIIENTSEEKENADTEELFIPFRKRSIGDNSSRGLGLSISRNIAEMHDGRLSIEWKDFKVRAILCLGTKISAAGNSLETI